MAVYFIRAGESGPVKIGKADDVMERLAGLQCGNPEPLRLIRTLDGGQFEEYWLHRHYRPLRLRGEWFTFCASMLTIEAPGQTISPTVGPDAVMPRHADLAALIDAHLRDTGMAASRFGSEAVGDPNFVRDLRAGREPRSRVVERVMSFMKAHRSSAQAAA